MPNTEWVRPVRSVILQRMSRERTNKSNRSTQYHPKPHL
jgi:hypothetical protein